jgi:hypothetical protein
MKLEYMNKDFWKNTEDLDRKVKNLGDMSIERSIDLYN